MDNNHVKPWTKLPGESRLWHKRFMKYVLLGLGRSVSEVWRQEQIQKGKDLGGKRKRPSTHWYRHFHDDAWEERADLWDKAELAREESEWRMRRRQLRQDQFRLAEALHLRCTELLEKPLPEFSHTDIVRLATAATELGRLAAEVPDPVQAMKITQDIHMTDRPWDPQLDGPRGEEVRLERYKAILRAAEIRRDKIGGDGHEN